MKLVTFENAARQSRIGAIAPENRVVDLHVLGIVDVSNITKPVLVSKAWQRGS